MIYPGTSTNPSLTIRVTIVGLAMEPIGEIASFLGHQVLLHGSTNGSQHPQLQYLVRDTSDDANLGCPTAILAQPQPVADHLLVAPDRGLKPDCARCSPMHPFRVSAFSLANGDRPKIWGTVMMKVLRVVPPVVQKFTICSFCRYASDSPALDQSLQ
jgi:hypothetical protein